MSYVQLFAKVALASSALDARKAFATYMPNFRELPVGVDPIDRERSWGSEQKDCNNSGSIEIMAQPVNAIYERLMNGFDANIDLYQQMGHFDEAVTTPLEALAVIAEDKVSPPARVYFFVSEASDGGSRQGKKKGLPSSNTTVVDLGAGQPWDRFGTTFMSLHGNCKIGNPLMVGSYGQGGHAVYKFSPCTIVYSRCVNEPSRVGFTIVYQVLLPGFKFNTYVYAVDEDGNVPFVDVADLPANLLIAPQDVKIVDDTGGGKANILFRQLLNKQIIMPEHGTVVRMLDLGQEANVRNKVSLYNSLRELSFGIESPIRFIHGLSNKAHGSAYWSRGLRGSLNDPRRTMDDADADGDADEKMATINPLLFKEAPVTILDGKATIAVWVLDRKSTAFQKERKPVESVLADPTNPIFVTLNGQAHARLPVAVLLRKAGLPHLEGHLIIEINCDNMETQERGKYFTSNRENITHLMGLTLKPAIAKYLASQDRLHEINRELLERLLRSDNTKNTSHDLIEEFAKIMSTEVAGAIFSNFGAGPTKVKLDTTIPTTTTTTTITTTGDDEDRPPPRIIELHAIPTMVEIFSKTVIVGETDEYIRVHSDAMDDWADAFSITKLPSFLKQIGKTGLRKGKFSYNVTVDPSAKIGDKSSMEITLDRSRVNMEPLIALVMIAVIEKPKYRPRTPPQIIGEGTKEGIKNITIETTVDQGLPPFKVQWCKETDDGFMDSIQPIEGYKTGDHALRYVADTDSIVLFINEDFIGYEKLMTTLSKDRKRDTSGIIAQVRGEYEFAAKFFAMADYRKIAEDDEAALHDNDRQHRSAAAAMKVIVMDKLIHLDRLIATAPVNEDTDEGGSLD